MLQTELSKIPARLKLLIAECVHPLLRGRVERASARIMQMDCWADDIVRISNDSTNDYMDRGDVEPIC